MAQHALKDILPGILRKAGATNDNFALLSLLEREISFLGKNVQIAGLRENKIYVELESSVHLQEASLRKKEILKSLKTVIPPGPLRDELDIKFILKGTNYRFPKFIPADSAAAAAAGAQQPAPFRRKVSFPRVSKWNRHADEKTD